MELARSLSSGADATRFFAATNAAFEKQNRDRRITDWLSVDGDGNKPVKWNLRAASLRVAAAPLRG
jgi:single-stranded DNA-binding protein